MIPGLVNNSVLSVDTISNNNQFTAKVDQLLPRNQSLSARLTYYNSGGFTPGTMGTPNMGYYQPHTNENASLGWTAPINASTVSEFRLGASIFKRYEIYFSQGYPNSDTLGIQGTVPISSNLIPPMPIIQFTGTDTFSELNYRPSGGENLSTLANNVYSGSGTRPCSEKSPCGQSTFRAATVKERFASKIPWSRPSFCLENTVE